MESRKDLWEHISGSSRQLSYGKPRTSVLHINFLLPDGVSIRRCLRAVLKLSVMADFKKVLFGIFMDELRFWLQG